MLTDRTPSPEEREHALRGMWRMFWIYIALAVVYFALPFWALVVKKRPLDNFAYFQIATAIIWAIVAARERIRIGSFIEKGYF